MKVITIGRNYDNNIVFDDQMISRRHAVLKIYPGGKYEIVSTGANGTKVNGNQISSGQPYPVKRGDTITFAHVANLDWAKVPDPMKPVKIGSIIAGALLVVVLALVFILPAVLNKGESNYDSVGSGSSVGVEIITPGQVQNETETTDQDSVSVDAWVSSVKQHILEEARKKAKEAEQKRKKAEQENAQEGQNPEAGNNAETAEQSQANQPEAKPETSDPDEGFSWRR